MEAKRFGFGRKGHYRSDTDIDPALADTAYIVCKALTPERVLTAALAPRLVALLEYLLEQPLAKEFIATLKDIAEIVTEGQL